VPAWEQALANQHCSSLWDVALIDGTDRPSPGYLDRLREWTRGQPFGPRHRIRLLRFGLDAEGQVFAHPGYKLAYARRLLWGKFAGWRSYDHLMSLGLDVAIPPLALERLHEADRAWAVAMLDVIRPLRLSLLSGELVRQVPFDVALEADLEYARACAAQGVYPALVPVT